MIRVSDDHPGRLVIESRDEITVTIEGVPKAEAFEALEKIADRRPIVIIEPDTGMMVSVEALAVIVARWEPKRPENQ